MNENINTVPDIKISVKQTFGIDSNLVVDAFSKKNEYVPEIDKNYKFDKDTTLAILSGFSFNKRVLVQGYHGTGKSTHIEQVAARLNWPCIRVNLDSHISRIDLIGKDAITIKDGKQITEFQEGILPWSIQNPIALVFDEYDAGRPDVMFVIQRVLEAEGNFTLLDKNKVLKQHKYFRLFATSNTVGLGDTTGLYHGTQQINQGQMDRWNIVTSLNYLSLEREMEIILAKNKSYNNSKGKEDIRNSATENLKILSDCLGLSIDELTVVVMDRTRHKNLIKEIRGCGAKVQPISDGDVQAAIACGFAGTGTHCLMGIGAAPEGVISAAAMRALGGHFQGQLVYDPAIAQTSEWADYTKEGNIKRLNEMGITDIDKIYEANELASGENVVFAGSGKTDGLLFDGVKFERDCVRTSSLVISTLDSTARFTNTVHIKDGAKSISL